jgi:acyl-coenzyme A thioesterase PaaI-like protein
MTDTRAAAATQLDWLTLSGTAATSPVLRRWQRMSRSAIGRWMFARAVCRRAPYFATISPRFETLQPSLCRVSLQQRRSVENHIGSIHALAMGNLCELAAGMVTEVSVPVTMRWIPRGMTIEYLRRAQGRVAATARLEKHEWHGAENVGVPVSVIDAAGEEVVRAVITMYVSPRDAGA